MHDFLDLVAYAMVEGEMAYENAVEWATATNAEMDYNFSVPDMEDMEIGNKVLARVANEMEQ